MAQRISSPFGTVYVDDQHTNALLEALGEKRSSRHDPVSMTPEVDIYENDTEFSIFMDLPGVDKESIQVSLSGVSLSVNAHTKKLERVDTGSATSVAWVSSCVACISARRSMRKASRPTMPMAHSISPSPSRPRVKLTRSRWISNNGLVNRKRITGPALTGPFSISEPRRIKLPRQYSDVTVGGTR